VVDVAHDKVAVLLDKPTEGLRDGMRQDLRADPSSTANRTWYWRDAKANVNWVFGMRWLPALGSQGQRAMQRNLRQQGFGWAVNHGGAVRLIGVPSTTGAHEEMGSPSSPDTKSKNSENGVTQRAASAAAAFACTHPDGAHALALEVPGFGVWFVASSQGCVVSDTDRWFDTLEQAQASLRPLRERYEQLQYTTISWQLDAAQASNFPEFLQGSLFKRCRFCRLPALQIGWPWLVFGVVVIGGLVVLGNVYWPATEQSTINLQNQTQRPHARPALPVHRYESLNALLETWHVLPVDPAGWLLQAVNCRVDHSQALCTAAYRRRAPDAHNEGLQGHTPLGWVFESDSLDRALFKRVVALKTESLQPHWFVSQVFGLSQLQRLSARVASVAIGATSVKRAARTVASVASPSATTSMGQGQGLQPNQPRQQLQVTQSPEAVMFAQELVDLQVNTPDGLNGGLADAFDVAQAAPAGPANPVDRGGPSSGAGGVTGGGAVVVAPNLMGGTGYPHISGRAVTLRLALRQAERLQALSLPLLWQQVDLVVVHGAQIDQLHGYLMLNLQGEWLETN